MKSNQISQGFQCSTHNCSGEILIIDEEQGYFCNTCKKPVSRNKVINLMYELKNEQKIKSITDIITHRDHLISLAAHLLALTPGEHAQEMLEIDYGIRPDDIEDYINRGGAW